MPELSQRQDLRLEQRLVITLQLQQAIKLLQLNHMELVEAVQKEMIENPALEEVPGTLPTEDGASKALSQTAESQRQDSVEQNNGAETSGNGDVDWNKVLEEYSPGSAFRAGGSAGRDDLPPIETNLTADESLAEHLLWQLNMQSCTDDELRAALTIIHNLDHRGWLDLDPEAIAAEAECDADAVEGAREIVMGLDPIGCGARSLVECLTVQARFHWPDDPQFVRIIESHLGDLETRAYGAIARALGIEAEDVVEYHKMLKELEPWPGRPFTGGQAQYITPDVTVVRIGGQWQILQNEDGLPRLRVSGYYRQVLRDRGTTRAEKDYIKERLDSADFLIKSIYKRQRTIHKVVQCVIERQKEFFDHGSEHLRPMVLRDISEEIGVHESTVSRVTTNKYLQCPHGIFELKYFFNAGIQRLNGGDLAGEAVKEKIKKLVGDENTKAPMSDQDIVRLLRGQNIKIARRTVAKYREAMGILPSNQRKQLF